MRKIHALRWTTPGSVLLALALNGCSAVSQPASDARMEAIDAVRGALELPDLPLAFVNQTGMVNAPEPGLPVAMYSDNEGRKYYVAVESNTVVEIDGRALLSGHSPARSGVTAADLRARADRMARAAFPQGAFLLPLLAYEEGQKGNNYFFTWRDDSAPVSFNRPFMQLAFVGDGQLFAYYNTLSPKR